MRPLRDRLGALMRLAMHQPGPRIADWDDIADNRDPKLPRAEETREHWRKEADRVINLMGEFGIRISEVTQ